MYMKRVACLLSVFMLCVMVTGCRAAPASLAVMVVGDVVSDVDIKDRQKKLLARGLDVQTETIYHEASISSWIEVQLASSQVIDGLGLPRGMVKKQPSCP